MTTAKILLVDDDPSVRASLADVLSDEHGYDVAEATDGNDGPRALGREAFDLVVRGPRLPF